MINKAHQNKRLSIQYSIKIPASHMSEFSQASVSKHWTGIKMIFYFSCKQNSFSREKFFTKPAVFDSLRKSRQRLSPHVSCGLYSRSSSQFFYFSSLPLNALFWWASTLKCPCHLMTSGVRFPFLL